MDEREKRDVRECRKRDLDGIEDLRDKAAEQGEEGGMPLYGGFCFLC